MQVKNNTCASLQVTINTFASLHVTNNTCASFQTISYFIPAMFDALVDNKYRGWLQKGDISRT